MVNLKGENRKEKEEITIWSDDASGISPFSFRLFSFKSYYTSASAYKKRLIERLGVFSNSSL